MDGLIDVRRLPGARQVILVREAGYFPVLALVGEREVVAVLRGGTGHVGRAGRLELVRSRDGGVTWLPPAVIVDSEWDDRNPAVGVAPDGALVVAYHEQRSYDDQGRYQPLLGHAETRVVRSHDAGRSWEHPQPLGFPPLDGRSPYGRMLTFTDDGALGMCIYGAPIGGARDPEGLDSGSYLARSTDGGRTWGDPSLVGDHFDEVAFLRFPDGELLAAMRRAEHKPSLHISRSGDGGRNWSAPVQATGPSEHPADLTLLGNGWVLMTYGRRHPPFGVQGMISRDRGHTWDTAHKLLYNDDRPGGDCGYPSTVRFADGMLVTAYYSAGDHQDSYRVDGAFAAGVVCPESALIAAVGG